MNTTKEKILSVGADLVRHKGFNFTGIQEILNEAGVPKGSFYFYFNSKEQFGIELIDVYMNFFQRQMEATMVDKSKSGVSRIRAFFNFFNQFFEKEGFTGGCPLGNLAQEMGDLNNNFRKKVSSSFKKMEKYIRECLKDAVESGEIRSNININEIAQFILNSWEGAVIRMKVEKSISPIRLMEKMILDQLIK